MKESFVLVDCNNFFVSCERLFKPWLEGKPVVILSSNDGCIVARSEEAKKLGLKMGEPYFKVKEQCELGKISVYSSNFQLYSGISAKIMSLLTQTAPEIEVYSVDEAFMKFSTTVSSETIFRECLDIKRLVARCVGIPVSIGIAPTKTLAKVANDCAKKKNRNIGVFNLNCPILRNEILSSYPIGEVWGIGSQTNQKLRSAGIFTAGDFIKMDPYHIRKLLGVVGERIFWELKGISALHLEERQAKKTITYSRSFGHVITDFSELAEALATFVNQSCVKLRKQKSCASAMQIYVETIPVGGGYALKSYEAMTTKFLQPTNDTSQMITAGKSCLKRLYKENINYKKCGIILLDLVLEKNIIPDFFSESVNPKRSLAMHAFDSLNERFGKNTLFFGAMGIKQNWKSLSQKCSLHNMSSWDQLPIVYARS